MLDGKLVMRIVEFGKSNDRGNLLPGCDAQMLHAMLFLVSRYDICPGSELHLSHSGSKVSF